MNKTSDDIRAVKYIMDEVAHIPPIKDAILREFTPTEAQAYTCALNYPLTQSESRMFRNGFFEVFSMPRVAQAAVSRGIRITVLGKDLITMDARMYDPGSQGSSMGSEITLGISIRGPSDTWPPPEGLIHGALADSLDPEDSAWKDAIRVSVGAGIHRPSFMLISLMMWQAQTEWATPVQDRTYYFGRYRFIWLEGSVEVVLDLRNGAQIWTRMPRRGSYVPSLVDELVAYHNNGTKLFYVNMRSYPSWKITEAELCPNGPLTYGQIEIKLSLHDRYVLDEYKSNSDYFRFAVD
ncbi:hypothetical protein K469DRAFT_692158 [Zopfia rhizophila CBS 207.26]|uniref:Uncharacterized protein n=1 Tax=Zopfia rhizophila CBS 207.26 TaxID=1314779 RepID=A0A6A6DNZ1_9PEZI|nr:hypothetical protein K469DRAFT_692158 [Zopfia rhizophila CBS 207.26]